MTRAAMSPAIEPDQIFACILAFERRKALEKPGVSNNSTCMMYFQQPYLYVYIEV